MLRRGNSTAREQKANVMIISKTATRFKVITVLGTCLLISPPVSYANNDATLCNAYGKIGGYMVGSLLPKTMQDFVDMMTGKNPEMLEGITAGLMDDLSGKELLAVSKQDENRMGLMGESAGQVAIQMLMAGQVADKAETVSTLRNNCMSVGVDTIISNQAAANAAINASIK